MNKQFVIFFGTFVLVYGTANYYVGMRFLQAFHDLIAISTPLYLIVYIFFALTPAISRYSSSYLGGKISVELNVISAYWMGITFYAFFLWALADAFRIAGSWLGILPSNLSQVSAYWGGTVLALLVVLIIWGSYNARRPVIRHYNVRIAKAAGDLRRLNAILVADIHLGPIIGRRRLERMVEMINGLNPDIIFFAGDIIDEDVEFFINRDMHVVLQRLKPPFGSFAVLGNHEYLGGHADQAVHSLEQAGMTVLRDNLVNIKDLFYIAGRDDPTCKRMTGIMRKPLADILQTADASRPMILIDHQPYDLEPAKKYGVDLMLAGHTHRGQFFPNNLITSRVFEVDWGYLRKGDLQVIVSCGFGTWGPPLRIGNSPELVHIDIAFDGSRS